MRSRLLKAGEKLLISSQRFPLNLFTRSLTLQLAKKIFLSSQIWQLIAIETYNVCNLRCKMCAYDRMTRKREKMGEDLFRKIVDDAAKSGIKSLSFSFYNESLLDPLLFERIRYVKSKGLCIEIITNGTLLKGEKLNEIFETEVDKVSFSFDGATKETYERIRMGANFEGVRKNILNFLCEREKRRRIKPLTTVGMTVSEDNLHEVKEFYQLWERKVDQISAWKADNRCEIKPSRDFFTKEKQAYPCPLLLTDVLQVLSNGKVALCCMDYDGLFSLGDLKKQSIREIRNSPKFRQIADLHLSGRGYLVELCNNCSRLYESHCIWWEKYFSLNRAHVKEGL